MDSNTISFEAGRLKMLQSYAILDSLPEASFDDIVKLATHICDVPIGMITFFDEKRQWFKSRVGTEINETPRSSALCAHTWKGKGLCLVPDTTQDPRFSSNPFVTGEAKVRFYAGVPLLASDGSPLGSLCIIDRVPRSLEAIQQESLLSLAQQVMTQLELRKMLVDQENTRFRMIADTLPHLIWSCRPNGDCDYVSHQWYTYTGCSPSDPLHDRWLDLVHPDDRSRTSSCWTGAVLGEIEYNIEYRIRAADGSYRWFKTRGSPMRDEAGEILYWFGSCTDIEDIVQAREVLAGNQQALEKLVEDRTSELAEQTRRAEEATKSKSQFLATMSHEIRTPMNGILGFAELLRDTHLNATQLRYTTLMQEAGKSLLAIINDILDLSKIEAGKIDLESIPMSPAALVDGTMSILRSQTQLKPIVLAEAVSPDVPDWVLGDPTRLRQVLFNLLSNAVKFTERGRVEVKVSVTEGQCLRFAVHDTGVGIAKHRQHALFQPFSQIDRSVTRTYGGTGLGLAISKRLVEAMGGDLRLESSSSAGSVFAFVIDMRRCDAPADYSSRVIFNCPAVPLDILVAEDLEMNRIIIEQILRNAGHRVTLVNNGLEALNAIKASSYDAILMDMEMPVMGGLEATMLIRKLPHIPADFPIIALTANALREDAEKAKQFGITMHLAKPIDRPQLLQVLSSYATQKAERQPAKQPEPEILNRELLGELEQQMGEMMGRIMDLSISEIGTCLDVLKSTSDRAEIHAKSHVLVSLAGNVGLTALTSMAREVMNEFEVETGSPDKLETLCTLGASSLEALRSFRQGAMAS